MPAGSRFRVRLCGKDSSSIRRIDIVYNFFANQVNSDKHINLKNDAQHVVTCTKTIHDKLVRKAYFFLSVVKYVYTR
jgi:hypothetical protein